MRFIRNKEQEQIIFGNQKCNNVIIARAGTGKTTTIIERIKYLIRMHNISPNRILLTTFTRAAAADMKSKIQEFDIDTGTLDSLALKTLKKFSPEIIDDQTSVSMYTPLFLDFLRNHQLREIFLDYYDYCFIDEFQDIDDDQHEIIKILSRKSFITAIGDPAQNIYYFRGSDPKYILEFKDNFENTTEYNLTKNYRSVPEIIDIANQTLNNGGESAQVNIECTRESSGIIPDMIHYNNSGYESFKIYEKIKEYIEKGHSYKDICVLARTNFLLYKLEELLTRYNIPHRVIDKKKNKVTHNEVFLSTIHKSKGLEWNIVFLIGCHDSYLPYMKSEEELKEERRLFYVATTRAKDYLHYSVFPIFKKTYYSRFISELEPGSCIFNYHKEEYTKKSVFKDRPDRRSVTNLIKLLNGRDLLELKELLPEFNYVEDKQLHKKYIYPFYVEKYNIYPDYGTFIDTLICRQLGTYRFHNADVILESIMLEKKEWKAYYKNKEHFEDYEKFLRQNSNLPVNELYDIFKTKYKIDWFSTEILSIINKYITLIIQNKQVNVLHSKDFPLEYLSRLNSAYNNFKNENLYWGSIISDIFEVSKCDAIIKNNRTRLIYRNNINYLVNNEIEWYESINTFFSDKMLDEEAICHLSIAENKNSPRYMKGELDLLINKDTIIDFKVSWNKDIQLDWIIQLLLYTYLCRRAKINIKKIGIYNPLLGIYKVIDISDWDKDIQLADFVIKKYYEKNGGKIGG
jgi:hypothetical protein